MKSKNFSGFALGTDVLLNNRCTKPELKKNWEKNIKLLNIYNVPYSITVTVDPKLNISELLRDLKNIGVKPQYFSLSEKEGVVISKTQLSYIKRKMKSNFSEVYINYGYKN